MSAMAPPSLRGATRRVGRAVVGTTAALVVMALAGCSIGLPDGVVRNGLGPSSAPGQTRSDPSPPPSWAPDKNNPVDLVYDFLEAAAGDYAVDGARAAAMEQMKRFVSKEKHGDWDPDPDLALIRLSGKPVRRDVDGVTTVHVEFRYVGVLTADGRVDPHEGGTRSYEFQFVRGAESGLFLKNPPNELLFNVDKLKNYYEKLPIYFWNSDGTSLVPDVRYLPKAVAAEQVNNRLVDWVLHGPSAWLDKTLDRLPEARRADSVVKDGPQVKVTLNTAATDDELKALGRQLYWTLALQGDEQLKLQANRDVITTTAEGAKGYLISASDTAERRKYAVRNGELTRFTVSGVGELLEAIEPQWNKDVLSAAVARNEKAFVLVRDTGKQLELDVRGDGQLMHSVAIPDVKKPTSMSSPVWLDRAANVALILVDGKLYALTPNSDVATPVESSSPLSKITALTVAPDGRRLGLVIGGRLYVAALQRNLNKVGTFLMAPPRRVPTRLDGSLAGVAFRSDDKLLAGAGGDKVRLTEVTVDGAVEEVYESGQSGDIANLTAYVAGGGRRAERMSPIMLDVSRRAYRAYNSFETTILESLAVTDPSPAPSPSVSPSGGTPQEVQVRAACFEG